jgi:hypothetical protein
MVKSFASTVVLLSSRSAFWYAVPIENGPADHPLGRYGYFANGAAMNAESARAVNLDGRIHLCLPGLSDRVYGDWSADALLVEQVMRTTPPAKRQRSAPLSNALRKLVF